MIPATDIKEWMHFELFIKQGFKIVMEHPPFYKVMYFPLTQTSISIKVKISEYLEKTGMSYKTFMEFIAEIDLRYFKRGDLLILRELKINEAKNDIKSRLIEKSKTDNYISLEDLDITSTIVEELLNELQTDEKVKGIFYNDQGELKFILKKDLKN